MGLGRVALAGLLLAICAGARADGPPSIPVMLKDHKFTPAEIHVKAGQPVILVITNQDSDPEEFDSNALKIEKVIMGGGTGSVRLRPLGHGQYPFQGEYHADTAQGMVVAD